MERILHPGCRVIYDILAASHENDDYTQEITRGEFCALAYETMAYMAGYIEFYETFPEPAKTPTFLTLCADRKRYIRPLRRTARRLRIRTMKESFT